MAKKNPSFLKRQKEQARKEKATEKRNARAEKKPGEDGEPQFQLDSNGLPLRDEYGNFVYVEEN